MRLDKIKLATAIGSALVLASWFLEWNSVKKWELVLENTHRSRSWHWQLSRDLGREFFGGFTSSDGRFCTLWGNQAEFREKWQHYALSTMQLLDSEAAFYERRVWNGEF